MGILTSRRRDDGGFEPSRLYNWLRPSESGNTINGLGESDVRRPTPVYHYIWVKHPWRRWQNSFYFRISFSLRYVRQFMRAAWLRFAPLKRIAAQKNPAHPQELTADLRKFLLENGAADVAVARMRPEWGFTHHEVTFRNVIVIGVPYNMDGSDSDMTKAAANPPALK